MDVSPQFMQVPQNTTSAANIFTEIQVPLPINRFPESSGKIVIIEVLKIFWDLAEADANNAAGGSVMTSLAQLSTSTLLAISPTSPRLIGYAQKNYRGAFTAAGTYQAAIIEPFVTDLTDGAGHGMLVATDNIYFGVNTAGFTGTAAFSAKILYRFKRVSLQEYIGIVQSQQ